jgi:hypothetical protein
MKSTLDDPPILEDVKAKQHRQHLNRFLQLTVNELLDVKRPIVNELLDAKPTKRRRRDSESLIIKPRKR